MKNTRENLLTAPLLKWYDQHGRKNLPWHEDRSAYRVWLSEIMLQQTQVTTVIPYFAKFTARFPTIKKLAGASLDEVLSLWAGLGYYSRARNLYRTAQIIEEQYEGRFPDTLEELISLPGVGKSTAGAILAQAFNKFGVILDGNVKRVLSRFHAISSPINQTKTEKILWELALDATPQTRLANYTQAIMDLGAMICTRSKPKCTECPLQKNCRAYQFNQVNLLPIKTKRQPLPTQEKYFLIIKNRNQEILLEQQPSIGLWGGLWSLPSLPTLNLLQRNLQIEDFLPEVNHSFSHYKLILKPVQAFTKHSSLAINEHLPKQWRHLKDMGNIGLPAPIKKILTSLEKI